jgi:hypothetical protein
MWTAIRGQGGGQGARLTRHASVASIVVAAACQGGRVHSSTTPAGAVPCAAAPSPTTSIDSAVVVVTSPVDLTNAPRATTFGETFIFGLTTERGDLTDCRGNALGIVGVSAPYVARAVGSTTIILDPAKPEIRPHITVISATETRARDLADAGVDLLITDSPSLATYVAKGPDAISIPLAYDRTWIVALPRPGQFAIDSAQTFRESLTRDVVPADARVAAGPIWWRDATGCAATARPVAAGGGTSRIVYSLNEPVGKALAERIVALAASGVTASGLAPNVFKAALRAGNDLAYVVPLARSGDDRCHHVDDLLSRADWLGTPGSIVPLIDTRLRAVARRNRLNLLYTRDSSITIVPRLP